MMRLTLARIAWILVIASTIGCTSLSPAKAATDLKAIAGKWKGTVYARSGQAHAYTSAITQEGRF